MTNTERYRLTTEPDSLITVHKRTGGMVYYAHHNEACTEAAFCKMPEPRFDSQVQQPEVKVYE